MTQPVDHSSDQPDHHRTGLPSAETDGKPSACAAGHVASNEIASNDVALNDVASNDVASNDVASADSIPPDITAKTTPALPITEEPGGRMRQPQADSIELSNRVFYAAFGVVGGTYVVLIVAMLLGDAAYMTRETIKGVQTHGAGWAGLVTANPMVTALGNPQIQHSIWLSLISCTMSAVLSVLVGTPMGYLMSRHDFRGKRLLDAVLDIPIVLPPLVIGLSLLILFQFPPFSWVARDVVYQVPSVVLAQFSVACAFSVRTMKATFDHIDPRCENVAISLGCSRFQAFGWVLLPAAARGMVTAFTLAWARSLGEFGPLLVFSGATPMKTEVLSTTVFLELNVGDIEAAVAVSFIMVLAAIVVLILTRTIGTRENVTSDLI